MPEGPVRETVATRSGAPVSPTHKRAALQATRPGAPLASRRLNASSPRGVQDALSKASTCPALMATTGGAAAMATAAAAANRVATEVGTAGQADGEVGVEAGVSIGGTSCGGSGTSDMLGLR